MTFLAQNTYFPRLSAEGKFLKYRVKTFGDVAFFLTQCTAWNGEISNFSTRKMFSPYHCKTKIAAPMTFLAKIPIFRIFQQKESFWKIGWIPLVIRSVFSWHSVQLESGKFQIFPPEKSFHLYHCQTKIAAPMKFFGRSTYFPHLSAEGKIFENRLNTFREIAFSLTKCTAWKREIWNFFTTKKVFTLPLEN